MKDKLYNMWYDTTKWWSTSSVWIWVLVYFVVAALFPLGFFILFFVLDVLNGFIFANL